MPIRVVDIINPEQRAARLRGIVFYWLLAYAASMTLPLTFNSAGTGLDPSWHFALTYFPWSDYKFGPDVIFTSGPLGFVNWPEGVGWHLVIAFAVRIFVWVVLVTELATACHRRRFAPIPCFLCVLSVVVAQPVLIWAFEQMLAIAALLLILRDHPEKQRFWRTTFPLSLLIALAFLGKGSGYVMLMGAFASYFALTYWQERRKPSATSLLRIGWVVAGPFIAYLAYNPSVIGLQAYVTGTVNLMSGYSVAMSVQRPLGDSLCFGSFAVLLLGFAIYGARRKWLEIEAIAWVMIPFFAGMKYSAVRHGATTFNGFGLVLFAILLLKCKPVKAATVAGGMTWALLSIVSLAGMSVWAISGRQWDPVPHLKQIGNVFHWKRSIASVVARTQVNLLVDTLPDSLLARIHGAPVVIFPWELAYGPANHLNLVPLYTLQSYTAYTNWLDRETAQHLAKTASDTRLLVEWKSIDGRHPLLDVPATWEAIYNGFEGELALPGLLLLKKRDHPAVFNFKGVKRTISDVHQWQNVPDREHAVSVSVSFSPTLLGTARGFLYKINPVYMDLETDRGGLMRFRVVPDVLRYPFVINCLPLDQSDLESFLFGQVSQQKVKRFRFSGDGLDSFSSLAEIAFAEAPDAPLRFASVNVLESDSVARDVRFGDQFLLRGAHLVPNSNGVRMELDWESLAEQPLKYMVFVHLIDQNDKLLAQADHEQFVGALTAPRVAKAGENWRDAVQLSRDQLQGVTRIALGIWEPPRTFLTADRGDRDWDNRRLILPVPR